ncbi:hypothetical protein L1987_65396 [Smallanthus sonchifolius]|uniref:Uncharacterized protein n=1 Tax=Smallanthus sonchifolius TaxID=185202 RepID=A0ACB9BUF9_9ASTR|nr:hypothetical protein L1987_65396 [Smallanthus sonchifolius]
MSYKEVLTLNPVSALEVTVPEDADFDAVQWYDKSVMGKMNDFKQLCCLHRAIEGIRDKIVGTLIAPSQAEFADKVLTYDTVGILAGEDWRRPEAVVLKWRNKDYSCYSQSEGGRESASGDVIHESDGSELESSLEGYGIQSEVEATINMGKQLGVNCNNIEDMIRKGVRGFPMNCLSLNCRGIREE